MRGETVREEEGNWSPAAVRARVSVRRVRACGCAGSFKGPNNTQIKTCFLLFMARLSVPVSSKQLVCSLCRKRGPSKKKKAKKADLGQIFVFLNATHYCSFSSFVVFDSGLGLKTTFKRSGPYTLYLLVNKCVHILAMEVKETILMDKRVFNPPKTVNSA